MTNYVENLERFCELNLYKRFRDVLETSIIQQRQKYINELRHIDDSNFRSIFYLFHLQDCLSILQHNFFIENEMKRLSDMGFLAFLEVVKNNCDIMLHDINIMNIKS